MSTVHERPEATITELFAEQVRSRPEATALRFLGEDLSYAVLDERSDRLARHLVAMGVGPECVVGVCIDRSFEMIVALLAILKAGGAYLPIHAKEPVERFQYMLDQAGTRILLTHERLAATLPAVDAEVLSLDAAPLPEPVDPTPLDPATIADSTAYVCYTSGSTGKPKGVSVPHRGVTRLVQDGDYAHFGPDETILQLCALTFDPATFEIWGALLHGGKLVIYQPGTLELDALAECLRRDEVTTLWLTTGLFHRMVDGQLDGLGGLRQLLAGGDVLSPAHINRVHRTYPNLRLVNGYGPTENTCFTTCHVVTEPVGERVPIGIPITGTRTYVLDDKLQPVADGEWGELFTSGAGLARGYLGRPGLTAEKFMPDLYQPGQRMYSIGDVVRREPDGALTFRGRRDNQVKVGGYRVELGEIEAVLAGQPRVKEAVVVVREDITPGEKVLAAYVVPEGDDENLLADLRLALHRRLPAHMIPPAIVILDQFPLTRNEKIDRKALPTPQQAPREVDTEFEAPRTPVEALLADMWSDALAIREVGVYDDFFELGGNSLMATDLLAKIRVALDVDVPGARLFYENATVSGLAEIVDKSPALSAQDGPAA
ncbi:amino acid adenylation domain-containing protein [Actinophytocola sp.]|uniref:amino acid adenylation domain-containing protein n=1 Tax=Actinophytocola sp. TaxID=1872138 RepID=UPI003D6BC3B2